MREIKFRVWTGSKMMEVGVLDIDDGRAMDYYNWYDGYCGEDVHYVNSGVLMQYTGLKDKNGKEIYEGDILQKFEKDYDSDEYKAWQDSGYEGEEPPDSKRTVDYCSLESFRLWLKNESFGYEGEELQSPDDWEVIGNIYENPELLKTS